MRKILGSAFSCLLISAALVSPAPASVVNLGAFDVTGQGLGVSDPLLVLQATGGATTETGTLTPLAGPTFGDFGWTSAANVRLLFNAAEPQNAAGKSISIDTISLTFQSGANTKTFSNAAPIVFPETNPGVGNAGFLIGLDQLQSAQLAAFLAPIGDLSGVRLGISAFLSSVAGGPDFFRAIDCTGGVCGDDNTSPVPLPAGALLFLTGLVGLGTLSMRRRSEESEGNQTATTAA